MRKWMSRILAAAAFCFCLLTGWTALSYSLRPDEQNTRTRLEHFYAQPADSLDVVAVGSSAIYTFVSPLRLYGRTGLTSAVYAAPNMSVPMIRYAVEECRKTQPNALYIIELRAMLATPEDRENIQIDLRRMTDNMPYSLNRARMLWALAPKDELGQMAFDLVKYHGRWKELRASDVRLVWGKTDALAGYQLDETIESVALPDWHAVNAQIEPDAQNEADFRALLEALAKDNVRALFVATPYALSRAQVKQLNAVGRITAEYGYPFLDFNKQTAALGLSGEGDYADFRHTNTRGMTIVTDALGERLLAECTPTLKTEAVQSWWTQAYASYAPMEARTIEAIEEKMNRSTEENRP